MPRRSPTKRNSRPLPYSRPSTTVPTPSQPHDGANGISAINPSLTNEERPDTNFNHSPTSSSSNTTTTTATSAATPSAPPSSSGTVQRPNFNTWHPIGVLHEFNARYAYAAMPDDHEMVQELRQVPLPENLRMENELRILTLDAWWEEEETRRSLALEPLQGPGRNGLPEGSGEEGRMEGGGQ
ncbi:MAG: hypothetical protein Q9207_001198 [Kuettlingeria erythrocarpa]